MFCAIAMTFQFLEISSLFGKHHSPKTMATRVASFSRAKLWVRGHRRLVSLGYRAANLGLRGQRHGDRILVSGVRWGDDPDCGPCLRHPLSRTCVLVHEQRGEPK